MILAALATVGGFTALMTGVGYFTFLPVQTIGNAAIAGAYMGFSMVCFGISYAALFVRHGHDGY